MEIRVESAVSERGEREPRAFYLGERRYEVIAIVDRWLDSAHSYFKVQTHDPAAYILRHDLATGRWQLAAFNARG